MVGPEGRITPGVRLGGKKKLCRSPVGRSVDAAPWVGAGAFRDHVVVFLDINLFTYAYLAYLRRARMFPLVEIPVSH